jgi:hypothetical protein
MYIFYPIVDIVKYLCIIYYLPLLLFSDFYFHSSFCFYQTDYQNIDYNVQQKICDMVYYSFLALLSSPQTIQNENWLISHINNLNCSKNILYKYMVERKFIVKRWTDNHQNIAGRYYKCN